MQGLNLAQEEVQIRWQRVRQGGGSPGKGLAAAGLPVRKADMKVRFFSCFSTDRAAAAVEALDDAAAIQEALQVMS